MRYKSSHCHRVPRRGFTLIELLVVIAIIALVAAILFPVFGKVREKGRQTTCTSNLKQLGLAFQQYASDSDGNFPAPISTYDTGPNGDTIPPTWRTGNPTNSDKYVESGGIWSYVKQVGNGGAGNVYGCPDGVSTPANTPVAYSNAPGATYQMNQYLQGSWGGLLNPSVGRGVQSKAGDDVKGQFTPFNPDMAQNSPSEVILLFEASQEKSPGMQFDGSVNRYGTPFYQGFDNPCTSYQTDNFGAIPCLQPADFHNGMSDFLFLDGHVKAMNPSRTWTQATATFVESKSIAKPSGVDFYTYQHAQGAGTVDMWNPNLPGTRMYVTGGAPGIYFP